MTPSLPIPHELLLEFPCNNTQKQWIAATRQEISNILEGNDPRLLLIVGPCSVHDIIAVTEYATRLRTLSKALSDTFYVVMRVYYEKPRTILGWKGFLYDPYLDGSHNMLEGIITIRRLLLDLCDLKIPIATEFLSEAATHYFSDLISWGCIGARTSGSPIHRQLASGLQLPIGFKNCIDGNVDVAVHGIIAANAPHCYLGIIPETGRIGVVHTQGNKNCHIVLRGGESGPNYDTENVAFAKRQLQSAHLPSRIVIDCSHDNAQKHHENQKIAFESVISQVIEGNEAIRGIMLESHLHGGNQPLIVGSDTLQYGISITDPCLDWDSTEILLHWGRNRIMEYRYVDEVDKCGQSGL